jgi:hypothetical protein
MSSDDGVRLYVDNITDFLEKNNPNQRVNLMGIISGGATLTQVTLDLIRKIYKALQQII